MTPETEKALRESIAHWERMRDDPNCRDRPGPSDCALCQLFAYLERCIGCPVKGSSGEPYCCVTPYSKALHTWKKRREAESKWQEAAQAEIDFLKSLLPSS